MEKSEIVSKFKSAIDGDDEELAKEALLGALDFLLECALRVVEAAEQIAAK